MNFANTFFTEHLRTTASATKFVCFTDLLHSPLHKRNLKKLKSLKETFLEQPHDTIQEYILLVRRRFLQICKEDLHIKWTHRSISRNLPIFTGKHQCQRLFFDKVATLLKGSLWHRFFAVNFGEFLSVPFLQNTSGRLLLTFAVLVNIFNLK